MTLLAFLLATWPLWLTVVCCVGAIVFTVLPVKPRPTLPPINTWRGDFADWMYDRCTLDEFLDRRWRVRNLK